MAGSATASGFSWISDGRSRTSKTRSKLTSAVITSIRTFERPWSGPRRRTSRIARAVTVPMVRVPSMARCPPTPYTRAVASAGTVIIAATKKRWMSAIRTPRSRTTAALVANVASSSDRRPNSLSSIAPPTLKRSVIALPRSALPSICSRVRPASRLPTIRELISRIGNISRHSSVTCQLSANIAIPTTTTEIALDTVPDRVEVKARCAPMTSLLSRDTSAPVWVRVKNARDWRWTWPNTSVRSWKIRPSPMRDEQ